MSSLGKRSREDSNDHDTNSCSGPPPKKKLKISEEENESDLNVNIASSSEEQSAEEVPQRPLTQKPMVFTSYQCTCIRLIIIINGIQTGKRVIS